VSPSPSDTPPAPAGSPDPSLTRLCEQYTHLATKSRGKALDKPKFVPLIAAAGGRDNVLDYCGTLLGATPAPTPTPQQSVDPGKKPKKQK
jgi:hypothetical protein